MIYRVFLSVISWFLCIACPVLGQETSSTTAHGSTTINTETEKAVMLEKVKLEIDFCKKNLGLFFHEVDVSKMGSNEGYGGVKVITHGLIASKYEWYGDYSKAAEHYYKDHLWESNPGKYWKRINGWGSPGDSMPFPNYMGELKRNQDYQKMLKVYPEYFDYYFLGRIIGPNGMKLSKEEEIRRMKEEMKYDTELKDVYDDFMKEWREIRKLAKTTSPKSLEPAVQHHEWFYSDKQEEVLKALAYYHANKVNFMLEKALKHKDPVISAKAKEYLESLIIGKGYETKH